jgi:hypothetical protein
MDIHRWAVIAGAGMMVCVMASIDEPSASAPMAFPPANPPLCDVSLVEEALGGDESGLRLVLEYVSPPNDPTDLESVAREYRGISHRIIAKLEPQLAKAPPRTALRILAQIATMRLYEGEFAPARRTLQSARELVERTPELAASGPDVAYLQAIAALRSGEVDNCVQQHCRTSCILPIDPQAVHGAPAGSREAAAYLTDFLEMRPQDPSARWLLNLAHMTLGQFPNGVPEAWRLPASAFRSSITMKPFRDVAAEVGLRRVDIAGGSIMDDFDGDGLLDVVVSTSAETGAMTSFRNRGDGRFEERRDAVLAGQLGGLAIFQTDYDNDGDLDVWVPRSAWRKHDVRPSLLRNDGRGAFTDVTFAAKLQYPMCSQVGAWGDYDNDGWLDLFCGAEQGRNRLYRNLRDGTFEEVALRAGVAFNGKCKGAAFGDFDRDGWPDLLVSSYGGAPALYHNQRDGTFVDVVGRMGIQRPASGFSCWFWDYDNDGWQDIYVSEFLWRLGDTARAMMGEPNRLTTGRLYRNLEGQRFEDVTARVGLDTPIVPMGSNVVDVDNDGFLDVYFGTGAPPYGMLLPNRMFKNIEGTRFADVSYASGTAHLQKGHQVACGDWDRDGDVDILANLGGAVPGDAFADALFENPGYGNHSLTVKLVGQRTNRAAIGARIDAVLEGARRVCRVVNSGSSFGANTLEQTIGLGSATRVPRLEVFWPVSRTTQVFRDVPADTAIEIVEGEPAWRPHPYLRKQAPRAAR